jgi:hypothetical protein
MRRIDCRGMRLSSEMRIGRANMAMRRDCVGGLHGPRLTSRQKEVATTVIDGPLACPLIRMEYPGYWRRIWKSVLSPGADGGRPEAHSYPMLAPRYPSCLEKSCCSSAPHAPGTSRSFVDFRAFHPSVALPLTMNRCWRACARRGAIVNNVGHAMNRGVVDARESSFAEAAARDRLGTFRRTRGAPIGA